MFRLSIVTPERVFFDEQVTSLIVPGSEGYLGVLSNHAPLITALQPGKIEFVDNEGDTRTIAVSGGFLEVSGNVATLLADTAEEPDRIDIERARKALKVAWEELREAKSGEELDEARAHMLRAKNRIRIYEQTH